MRTLLTVATILIATPFLGAEPQTHRDIAYTTHEDEQRTLDLYAPAEGNDHPVAIWIHGGGWRRGDKLGVQQKPAAFVEKGFVFVSVNYRFVPNVTVKEMTGDIAKAIKWVHDHAEEYGGSPDNLFVIGHSAGAHLAALVCTDDRYLKAEGLSLSNIKGCVPVDTAAYDIARQAKNISPLRQTTYTTVFGRNEDQQKELSPMTHVAKDKNIPPFLILHVADRPDSRQQSEAFAKGLGEAGVKAKVVAGEGKTHTSINRELGLPDDKPTLALFEFLEQAGRN
ncbi:MAG: alpha/beta hydrolase [Planctomycetes bacterium]|nr:alpha/beta hydrolase [Planctomycetota bacterium]